MEGIRTGVVISPADYDAVIDLDGVLTRTAVVHAAAGKELLDDYLQHRTDASVQAPFDIEVDYRRYVDFNRLAVTDSGHFLHSSSFRRKHSTGWISTSGR